MSWSVTRVENIFNGDKIKHPHTGETLYAIGEPTIEGPRGREAVNFTAKTREGATRKFRLPMGTVITTWHQDR